MPNATTTLVGTDTTQTLTNKTIGVGQLNGQVAVVNGGTGAQTVDSARSNLEIFNTQSATAGPRIKYSGKIYVVPPSIAGTTGTNLVGATTNDLWFW
jgi:hypothetical protein